MAAPALLRMYSLHVHQDHLITPRCLEAVLNWKNVTGEL